MAKMTRIADSRSPKGTFYLRHMLQAKPLKRKTTPIVLRSLANAHLHTCDMKREFIIKDFGISPPL